MGFLVMRDIGFDGDFILTTKQKFDMMGAMKPFPYPASREKANQHALEELRWLMDRHQMDEAVKLARNLDPKLASNEAFWWAGGERRVPVMMALIDCARAGGETISPDALRNGLILAGRERHFFELWNKVLEKIDPDTEAHVMAAMVNTGNLSLAKDMMATLAHSSWTKIVAQEQRAVGHCFLRTRDLDLLTLSKDKILMTHWGAALVDFCGAPSRIREDEGEVRDAAVWMIEAVELLGRGHESNNRWLFAVSEEILLASGAPGSIHRFGDRFLSWFWERLSDQERLDFQHKRQHSPHKKILPSTQILSLSSQKRHDFIERMRADCDKILMMRQIQMDQNDRERRAGRKM